MTTFEDETASIRDGLARAGEGDLVVVLAPPEVGLPALTAPLRAESKGPP